MKYYNYLLIALLMLASCKEKSKQSETLPSNSIFNLSTEWQNQKGETLQLKNLQGKTLVVVMIYTSCKTACPILVAKMKTIEEKIDRKDIEKVSLVLVSIDPETDTPTRLAEFAKINKMDAPQWVFLTSNKDATQEFANVLSMKYKRISPIDFSHSNIISIFKPNGQLVSQEEGSEINVEKVVTTVTKTVKSNS
ncbi:MAG: SCO family protein [Chitinophagales bacterium]|nr:SCO family protein [Chitinophagales bacterium]OJV23802.1 MAG: SCO family protein [Bacteroidetes bacterium 37-13]HRN95698.1 SCO family protein [Chitinophagales bacterium]HRP40317.1 SCO family protein [Chitinophagales bacterium]